MKKTKRPFFLYIGKVKNLTHYTAKTNTQRGKFCTQSDHIRQNRMFSPESQTFVTPFAGLLILFVFMLLSGFAN